MGETKNRVRILTFTEVLLLTVMSSTQRRTHFSDLQFDFGSDKGIRLLVLVCTLLGQFSNSNRARLLENSSLMKRWTGNMP